jgi:hypothetical protein
MKRTYFAGMAMLAAALGAPTAAAMQAEAPKAEKPRLICKTDRVTGSLTRVSRVCATQAQWDRMTLEAQRAVDRVNQNSGTALANPGPSKLQAANTGAP